MDSKRSDWLFRDFRFWMVVVSLTLLLWISVRNYPGF
jgi:hypothetical protein